MTNSDLPELITLDDMAAMLRIGRKTLLNWRSSRRPGLPVGFRPAGGRVVLFRRTDVEKWIDDQIEQAR